MSKFKCKVCKDTGYSRPGMICMNLSCEAWYDPCDRAEEYYDKDREHYELQQEEDDQALLREIQSTSW